MGKIPASTDSKQADSQIDLDANTIHGLGHRLFGQAPTEPSPGLIAHWKAEGERLLAEPDWKVTFLLSQISIEDYALRREHIAAGRFMTVDALDELYQPSNELRREHVLAMPELDWLDSRKELSKAWAWPLQTMETWRKDAAAEAKKATKTRQQAKEKAPDNPPPPFPVDEPWEAPVDLAAVLGEIREILAAHMAMADWQVRLIASWVALTYYRDDEELWYAPLLGISSPVLQCGKSRLLGLIQKLCRNSLPVSSISPAAIYRAVDLWHPTLFYDELDAVFSRKGENEELRAVFNSGYSRDFPFVVRCAEKTHEPEAFNGFGFKAFAGIGEAPATVRDRAVLIPLARRPAGVHVRRIDRKYFHQKSAEIRRKLLRWSQDNQGVFSQHPDMDVEDRARDNLEPLLCIAERAGAGEADSLRTAIAELTKAETEDSSTGIRLLTAIRPIIEDAEKITSTELIMRLCEAEDSEWKELGRKREEITPRDLSRLLKPFEVKPRAIRIDGKTVKGYALEMFLDPFSRYLSVTSVTTLKTKDLAPISIGYKSRSVTDNKSGKPFKITNVTDATDGNAEIRGTAKEKNLFTDQSHESREHVTAAFGVLLGEIDPEEDGFLKRLVLDLEAKIASGELSLAEGRIYLWDAVFLAVKPPALDRWWTTPVAELSAARLSELESGRLLPPGLFSAKSWGVDLPNESGPGDIMKVNGEGR